MNISLATAIKHFLKAWCIMLFSEVIILSIWKEWNSRLSSFKKTCRQLGKAHLQLGWDKTAKETSFSNSWNLDVWISTNDIEIRHYHMEHQRGKNKRRCFAYSQTSKHKNVLVSTTSMLFYPTSSEWHTTFKRLKTARQKKNNKTLLVQIIMVPTTRNRSKFNSLQMPVPWRDFHSFVETHWRDDGLNIREQATPQEGSNHCKQVHFTKMSSSPYLKCP